MRSTFGASSVAIERDVMSLYARRSYKGRVKSDDTPLRSSAGGRVFTGISTLFDLI